MVNSEGKKIFGKTGDDDSSVVDIKQNKRYNKTT